MRQLHRGPKRARVISDATTHKMGRGGTVVRKLTVLRPGPLVDMGVPRHVADMYADVFPYLSLAGLDIDREENRRGNTMRDGDESHIQARTGGKIAAKKQDGRSHHRGRAIEPLVRKEHRE